MDVPFSYMQSYVERLEKGQKIERSLTAISEERDRIVKEYRALIKIGRRQEVLRRRLQCGENHLPVCRRSPLLGGALAPHHLVSEDQRIRQLSWPSTDVLKKADDIYLFNRFEVPMLLEDLATAWALGIGAPTRGKYWMEKAEKREKILAGGQEVEPGPCPRRSPCRGLRTLHGHAVGHHSDTVGEWLKGGDQLKRKTSTN